MPTKHNTKNTQTRTQLATEKLTEARTLLATREAGRETAEETAPELVARLTRGDESVSALDLLTAEAEVTRLGYLIEHAKRAIPAAERELDKASAIDNPTLARWLAERIEADGFAFGLYGIEVKVTTDQPNGPGLYLLQPNATKVNPQTGLMSGRVNLQVITPNRATSNGRAILAGLAAIEREGVAEVQGSVSPSPEGVSVMVDIANLKPTLPTLPEHVDPRWIEDLAYEYAKATTAKGGERTTGNGLYEETTRVMGYAIESARLVDQVRDGEEIRRLVEVDATFSGPLKVAQLTEYAESSANELPDTFAAGVGRVIAAKFTPKGWEDKGKGRNAVTVAVEIEAAARLAD